MSRQIKKIGAKVPGWDYYAILANGGRLYFSSALIDNFKLEPEDACQIEIDRDKREILVSFGIDPAKTPPRTYHVLSQSGGPPTPGERSRLHISDKSLFDWAEIPDRKQISPIRITQYNPLIIKINYLTL